MRPISRKFSLPSLQCKVCNKLFANVYRLQRHMISHDQSTDLRRFKCEECGKAFKFKHHLKEHLVRHDFKYFFFLCIFQCRYLLLFIHYAANSQWRKTFRYVYFIVLNILNNRIVIKCNISSLNYKKIKKSRMSKLWKKIFTFGNVFIAHVE